MAYNGSGVFQRLYNFVTDRNNGIKIRADRMDAELDGIATGLSNCITKDGQTTITGNIPFNDKRITGLGDASADADALNRRSGDARYLELDGTGTMTGPVRAANGSAASPSITFGADTNSGLYRAAEDDIRGAVNGADVFRMRTAGVDVTGAMAATGAVSGTTGTFSGAIAGTTGTFSGAITMQSRAVDAFPSGTLVLFQQTAAPTGWTKQTTHDNKALRVVSGTAGSGGLTAFTSVFTSRTISQANLPNVNFTGSTNTAGAHTHTYERRQASTNNAQSGSADRALTGLETDTTSSAGNHSHTVTVNSGGSGTALDFAVQYVDVIIAAKNS